MDFSEKVISEITGHFEYSKQLYLDDLKTILTKRQIKIISFKLKGHTNTYIAGKLDLCPATITQEFKRIRKKVTKSEYFKDGYPERN